MDDIAFVKTMVHIESAIKDAGYDPYEQLVGYLQTGQDYYITRRENARVLIKTIDRCKLDRYVYGVLGCNDDKDPNVVDL